MTVIDWGLLSKIVGVMAVGGTCIGIGIKVIVFFTKLNTSVDALTALARELQVEAKKFGEQYTALDKRLGKVEVLLDLDDNAQEMIRERHDRREWLRRDRDRVNQEIRDVFAYDKEKQERGDA